jgi:hypothetical protein
MKKGDLLLVNNHMSSYYLYSKHDICKNDIGVIVEVAPPFAFCFIKQQVVLLYPEEFTIISKWN